MSLPTDPKTRKEIPIFSGFLAYFPHAIAAAAQLSFIGNKQHNPGQPLHWAKEKSTDETDAQARHLLEMAMDEQHRDPDGVLAAVKNLWRAAANLERMHDRGIDIFWMEPPPDQFCVSTPDGGCVSTDPRDMHQPPTQTDFAEADFDLADDGNYIIQVVGKESLDSPLRSVSYFGPFKTLSGAEQAAHKYTPKGEVSIHALNFASRR